MIDDFLTTFNEFYPFERYLMREPKSIDNLFDDLILTELFIPSTEADESFANNGLCYLNNDEIYAKFRTEHDEIRMAFSDLSNSLKETIVGLVIEDFGDCEWESLYIEKEEDDEELKNALFEEKSLIIEKYGECNIKDNFIIESTINMLN